MKLRIHTDGGSRGNPGPAAIGVVVFPEHSDSPLFEQGLVLGVATNNVAEYSALLHAFTWLQEQKMNIDGVTFFLDSQLVVEQMNGRYKIKDARLRALKQKIDLIRISLSYPIIISYIPREKNKKPDQILNKALDLHPLSIII